MQSVKLKRVKVGQRCNVYTAVNSERVYLLYSVNRQYSHSKKPVYYLKYRDKGMKEARYISGLFKTDKPDVFSFDIKDPIGMKQYFYLIFSDNGTLAEVKPADKIGAVYA